MQLGHYTPFLHAFFPFIPFHIHRSSSLPCMHALPSIYPPPLFSCISPLQPPLCPLCSPPVHYRPQAVAEQREIIVALQVLTGYAPINSSGYCPATFLLRQSLHSHPAQCLPRLLDLLQQSCSELVSPSLGVWLCICPDEFHNVSVGPFLQLTLYL